MNRVSWDHRVYPGGRVPLPAPDGTPHDARLESRAPGEYPAPGGNGWGRREIAGCSLTPLRGAPEKVPDPWEATWSGAHSLARTRAQADQKQEPAMRADTVATRLAGLGRPSSIPRAESSNRPVSPDLGAVFGTVQNKSAWLCGRATAYRAM